jgi:hypothetical protein
METGSRMTWDIYRQATFRTPPNTALEPAFILNAFFSVLLVILGAQFSCGHETTCISRSSAIANGIGGEPSRQDS